VNRSGKTLTEIVNGVKRVTDIVGEIAAASKEQATGIDQVGKAMTQMDQVTQQNSAQTEELSSTAQSLATQAEQLQALVAQFIVDDRHGRLSPSATHPAPPARAGRPQQKRAATKTPQTTTASLNHLASHLNEGAPQTGSFVEF
jgi:methyl-accepting chemotaxis protein